MTECHNSSLKNMGDLQRISLIFWSKRAFISLCKVPPRWSLPAGTQEGMSSRLSMLASLLDALPDRQSPFCTGFTWSLWLPRSPSGGFCQWMAGLRFTAGVCGTLIRLRGQLCERPLVCIGEGGRCFGGRSKVRLSLAGDGGGTGGGSGEARATKGFKGRGCSPRWGNPPVDWVSAANWGSRAMLLPGSSPSPNPFSAGGSTGGRSSGIQISFDGSSGSSAACSEPWVTRSG